MCCRYTMGAEFLVVDYEESGDGDGGYAKEMSPEFIEAGTACTSVLHPKPVD